MKNMRHVVTVMRPTEAQDEYGQTQGEPTVLFRDVPCSIEPLSGREAELGRQMTPVATLRVRLYCDPKKPITRRDYLQQGARKLHIADIIDKNQNGVELELLCGEETV